jgi:type I restriction enzyme S subunit
MTEENKSIKKFPNLRFPGFEDEWEVKKLGDIAEKVNSGKTPLGGEAIYTKEGILFIRSQNVNNDKLELENSTFIPESVNNQMKNSIVRSNDILLNITGASLGRSCVVPDDFEIGNVNQHVCIIRLNQQYYPKFIQPIFSSSKGQNIFNSLQTGSGREGLNFESIKGIKLAIPNQKEQQQIASFLSLTDDRIQTQKKIIGKLETLMKGNRERIFSQKLRFKNEQGSDFSTWERKKIKEILTIGSGKDYKHLNDGTIPVYGTGGVIAFVDSFLYDGATVCIGRKGTIDKPLYYNGKIWTVDTLFYTHSFNNSVPKFVFNVFQNINWKEYNEASGVPSLSKNTIENIEISIPCLEEQYKIINFLTSIQEKIETEKQILEKLELQKKFLLGNLFV